MLPHFTRAMLDGARILSRERLYSPVEEKNTKTWVYFVIAFAFSLVVIGLTALVSVSSFGLHFQIDVSSVSSNNTTIIGNAPSNTTVIIIDGNVVFAKIALQNIPTLINGITTSTSIIVAFSGAVIGFMVRDFFPSDKKAKIAFFGVMFSFAYVFMYLFWVYVFLATGGVDLALRWSLDGLLISLLIFVLAMLLGHYRLDKTKSDKTEPDEKEPEKNEPKPDQSKNVNVVVS